ncbi:MAG: phosphoribosylformylglycinamidine synthase II, partial [Thermomicrobia bacterium]|nr:phosphoribosylformylglycinamidine synthase II [Thermomicrobia bacterium]
LPDATLLLLGPTTATTGASLYLATVRDSEAGAPPALDLDAEAAVQECVRWAIRAGQIRAAHDLADGGLAVALAEGCIAGRVGCEVALPDALSTAVGDRLDALLFGEAASRVILAVAPEAIGPIEERASALGLPIHILGRTTETRQFALRGIMNVPLHNLITAWETALA